MSIPDALGEVAKQSVKQLAPEIYSDGIKPGMKKLGAALETVIDLINTCLVPVAILNDRARLVWDKHLINRQKYLLDYEQNLLKIPEEKIVSPIPEIAVPILQRLEYTQNDQLAKMFLNLLTTASNSDTESNVHPAFINVISNISPDEARILNYLSENENLIAVFVRFHYNGGTYSDHFHTTTILDFEVIENIKFSRIYLANLISLGLISDKFNKPIDEIQSPKIKAFLAKQYEYILNQKQPARSEYKESAIHFTEFGKLFVNCCLGTN